MKKHDELIKRLEQHQLHAPDGFSDRVMEAIPSWRPAGPRSWLMRQRGRLVSAIAGAAVMFVIMMSLDHYRPAADVPGKTELVTVHFELHAPGASQVELLGDFNSWKTGNIVLAGPDASGHWTATVQLPEGRHEYIFLVDGDRWIADPKAATVRPDGFGHVNAVIQVYDENNA